MSKEEKIEKGKQQKRRTKKRITNDEQSNYEWRIKKLRE